MVSAIAAIEDAAKRALVAIRSQPTVTEHRYVIDQTLVDSLGGPDVFLDAVAKGHALVTPAANLAPRNFCPRCGSEWERDSIATQATKEDGHGNNLLPCPFCGRSAHFSRSDELVNVRCEGWNPGECLGAGPNCYTEAKAATDWNRRAAPVAAQAPAAAGDAQTTAVRDVLAERQQRAQIGAKMGEE